MNYDAWRITFQSSEQAAQAAYQAWQQAQEERDELSRDYDAEHYHRLAVERDRDALAAYRAALAAHIERLKEAGEAAALEAPAVTQAAITWGDVCEQSPAVSLAHRDALKRLEALQGVIDYCKAVPSSASSANAVLLIVKQRADAQRNLMRRQAGAPQ